MHKSREITSRKKCVPKEFLDEKNSSDFLENCLEILENSSKIPLTSSDFLGLPRPSSRRPRTSSRPPGTYSSIPRTSMDFLGLPRDFLGLSQTSSRVVLRLFRVINHGLIRLAREFLGLCRDFLEVPRTFWKFLGLPREFPGLPQDPSTKLVKIKIFITAQKNLKYMLSVHLASVLSSQVHSWKYAKCAVAICHVYVSTFTQVLHELCK